MEKKARQNQAIRNIIIFTILVNGLAWLGPVLVDDITMSGWERQKKLRLRSTHWYERRMRFQKSLC